MMTKRTSLNKVLCLLSIVPTLSLGYFVVIQVRCPLFFHAFHPWSAYHPLVLQYLDQVPPPQSRLLASPLLATWPHAVVF